MKFFVMDEAYADRASPRPVTVLTGMLVAESQHRRLREGFYTLLNAAIGVEPNVIHPTPEVHAMSLFPDLGSNDGPRFAFLEGLVDLALEVDAKIYRVGYDKTPEMMANFKTEDAVISLCFLALLWSLKAELKKGPVWPIMEISRSSKVQDRAFAGQVQNVNHITSRFGSEMLSIDNTNLGEVLYVTKSSALGAIVDCLGYLRQAVFLRESNAKLSAFKTKLADIGDRLKPAIAMEEIVHMKIRPAPRMRASRGDGSVKKR